MLCPYCGHDRDRVIDSRSCEGGRVTRRRRLCLECDRRYTTHERPELFGHLRVVKKDGVFEPYSREKVIAGLEKACFKCSLSSDAIRRIAEKTEELIFKQFDKDVPSRFIGDTVSGLLLEADKLAYVRFASVYREFEDVGQFIDEAQDIRDDPVVGPEQQRLFNE